MFDGARWNYKKLHERIIYIRGKTKVKSVSENKNFYEIDKFSRNSFYKLGKFLQIEIFLHNKKFLQIEIFLHDKHFLQ